MKRRRRNGEMLVLEWEHVSPFGAIERALLQDARNSSPGVAPA
jgi:hypothetical protein